MTASTLLVALVCLLAGPPEGAPAARARKEGLLPPAIVVFEERAGTGTEPVPDLASSSSAGDAIRTAFLAELAAKGIAPTPLGEDETGPADLTRLLDLPGRIEAEDRRPPSEALLSAGYPPASVQAAMDRHQLDAVWLVSGIAVPQEGAGKRLLLRAALVDRQGKVLHSDVVDRRAADPRDPQVARRAAAELLAEYRTEPQKTASAETVAGALEVQAKQPRSPHPFETRLGFGVFFFAPDGRDLQVGFLPKNSHWQIGYRYVRWTDTFEDPYTEHELTETTETLHGPLVNYFFRPHKRGTWYVGLSVFSWSRNEVSTVTGASDSASILSAFVGGGYTRRMGKHAYFNTAVFIAPWVELKTSTGVSSEDSSGAFDVQLQIGAVF